MTDELHNHIAAMVCETDEPGKPADVTAALDGVGALVAEYRARVETFDGLTAIMGELRTERGKPMRGLHQMTAEKLEALAAALAEQTARAEAAEARVAELTAKLEAPVQVDAAHIRAEALREVAAVVMQKTFRVYAPKDFRDGYDVAKADAATAILALIPTAAPSPDARGLLMVENIDTISDLCRKHKVKEPSFRAILRALAAQEGGE